jgi:DNA-binding protein HU-beta
MNKEELVKKIAEEAEHSQKDAKDFLDAAIKVITSTLQSGDKVTLVGFGTFQVKERAAREGRNPRTGKPLKIPAKKAPVFAAGKSLKDAVAAEPAKKGKKKK